MSTPKYHHEKSLDLDEVLTKFKLFGRYHLMSALLISFACVSNSIYAANYIFAAEEVSYRCADDQFGNGTTCRNENSTFRCSKWLYDKPNSFVGEFQLACQEWKRTLVGTTHSLGYMCGLLIVGPLSDRLGRKMTLIMTGVSGGLIGIAKSFAVWYWLYIGLEFLEAAIGDICSPMYMLAIEMVATKKRAPFLMLLGFGYPVGGTILALVSWAVPYWRNLLRVLYAPALLFITYLYFIDESPRWLLTKGKKEIAVTILEKAAAKNKMKLHKDELDRLKVEEEKDVAFADLLKNTFHSRTILKRFSICIVWWITATFVNYGLTINSVSLQGNKYINFTLVSLVDIPGSFIITYILVHYNRKVPLIYTFALGAMFCLVQPFMPDDFPWLSILFYMASKMMASFYFTITYMFTSELFPTYTRNSMHALCSSIGRVGSIIAPQTPLLMQYWVGLPSVLCGGLSLFAMMVTFLVPDTTANDALPDTVKQAEALGVKSQLKKDEERCSRL